MHHNPEISQGSGVSDSDKMGCSSRDVGLLKMRYSEYNQKRAVVFLIVGTLLHEEPFKHVDSHTVDVACQKGPPVRPFGRQVQVSKVVQSPQRERENARDGSLRCNSLVRARLRASAVRLFPIFTLNAPFAIFSRMSMGISSSQNRPSCSSFMRLRERVIIVTRTVRRRDNANNKQRACERKR